MKSNIIFKRIIIVCIEKRKYKSYKKYKNIKGEILDIGSGSGILGLLVSNEYKKLNLNQCEIQKMFQFFSTKNALTNKINTNLYEGSFEKIEFDKKFDKKNE